MHPRDSRQIEIIRAVSITAMMWVHVNPGLSTPTIVSTGEYHLVGTVLGNTLGRISVSLLSFISGYLLWQFAIGLSITELARRRFENVIVPMLVWSAIFILMAAAKGRITGTGAQALADLDVGFWGLLNALSGLAGPTANLSLFFLRDLFVATLIVRLAAPLIQKIPVAILLVALSIPVTGVLEPLIFRKSILQFLLFGALAARWGITIRDLSRPFVILPIGYLLTISGLVALDLRGVPVISELNISLLLRRLGLCLLLLVISAAILRLFPRAALVSMGRHSFLAYLLHVPTMGVMWTVWQWFGGSGDDPSYLIFYLGAPLAAFALAVLLGQRLNAAPPLLQIAFRGKIRSPDLPVQPD